MALGRHGRAPRAVALGGVVGAHVGGPDEERPVAGRPALDQVDGLVAHHVGDVAVVGARAPVVVEARAVVAVGVGDRRAPVVPAAHPARARGVGVQRLADEPGAVAGVVQPGREVLLGVVAGEGLVAAVGPAVVAHAVVLGVLPGEDLRARRAAQRVGLIASVNSVPASASRLRVSGMCSSSVSVWSSELSRTMLGRVPRASATSVTAVPVAGSPSARSGASRHDTSPPTTSSPASAPASARTSAWRRLGAPGGVLTSDSVGRGRAGTGRGDRLAGK